MICENCETLRSQMQGLQEMLRKKDRVIDSFEDHISALNHRIKEL